jgi:Spy/CpxP family protein refolding chaperone
MATNKLMEAAAEILAGSKKSAPGMPMQKPEGAKIHDAGGPTPQNFKATDDSAKISASSTSATAPTTKPSAASSDTQNKPAGGKKTMREDDEQDEELIDEVEEADAIAEFKSRMKEDVTALFADDQTISEDFKSKAATIFEARVIDRVTQIQEDMESEYAGMLEEAVEQIKSDLTEKVDDYLNYVVEQWMEENQIAIESGLRSEITEDFIAGLRNLFAENYINVPEESVDLVEELAAKVEELETKLNEEIETNIVYKKALTEAIKEQLTVEVCEGLTATQVEKIKSLAESVDFSTEEEFVDKLETLRENYFPSGIQKAKVSHLHEQFEDTEEKKAILDPFISAVSQAISKTKI